MALDKQKILNELGNVVNQLQSADCGCMGKLFNNSNQANSNSNPMISPAHDGCMRGCGHGHCCHGHNAPCAGEPYTGGRHCMGFCNPPKLYADTYSYLNQNLLQPVVREVYDDLKSISPNNTVMNSPLGAQMGLTPGGNLTGASSMGENMGGNMGGYVGGNTGGNMLAQNQMPGGTMENPNAMSNINHGANVRFGNVNMENLNNPTTIQNGNPNSQQQMAHMAGMGPQIFNMMKGSAGVKQGSMPNQGGQQGGVIGNHATLSPEMGLSSNMPGDVGQGQFNTENMPGNDPGQYGTTTMRMNNIGQGNPGTIQNPTSQYMSQPNMYAGANANAQGNPMMTGNMTPMNPGPPMGASLPNQQMNAHNPYGQHSAGISKFNEMFPGVMQGDLGFDPMAIAIQMNPANKQQAAMDTMQKMMLSNGDKMRAEYLQPVINATNAATANINRSQSNQLPTNQPPSQQSAVPPPEQQLQPGTNATAVPVHSNQIPPQQVYTNLTGTSTMNRQQMPQQQMAIQQQQYEQQQYQGGFRQPQQQIVDPSTGAVTNNTLPTLYEGAGDPNVRQDGSPPGKKMYMEPIFPADTSRNLPYMHMKMKPEKYNHYNNLGQPVGMLPPSQIMSPQQVASKIKSDATRYSNVKNTISKTSLMGAKPVGKTPSRSQLQHLYNQYKGSHSYTQQNIRPADNGASYSEGHLNVQQGNTPVARHAPVEKLGGDTAANNFAMNREAYKVEQMPGQVGDVPAADKPVMEGEKIPVNYAKVRNGLQDQTYTSYATSAAWTFHGVNAEPYSLGYRFRPKL